MNGYKVKNIDEKSLMLKTLIELKDNSHSSPCSGIEVTE